MSEAIFIILGATGDLAKRKLIPAIYKLVEDKKIDKLAIIGVAFSDKTIDQILENSKKFIPKINAKVWNKIKQVSTYQQLDFYNSKGYLKLKELIEKLEKKHNIKDNKIFYLATLPEHFEVITKNLAKHEIVTKHKTKDGCKKCKHPWSRIVYEKPFGTELKSARKINKAILALFHEKQIYRIDHFLGKELVSNIALVRFTNRIFEPLWNNKHVDSVQIIMKEKIGLEGRGGFYDKYGAIKDVVQNHMLQILALVAMEAPERLEAKSIRDAKVKVLKKTTIDSTILGQYQGYKKEEKVDPKSKTETFAALKLLINNKRWKDVPFYLITGKYLAKTDISIHIKFKMVKCLLEKCCPQDSNYLTIKIQPEEGFYLELNTKKPRTAHQILPIEMNFCHSCMFGPNTPAAYETLLCDVIKGDQSAFVRSDEIEESWKIVEKINRKKLKQHSYQKGSNGPKELKLLDKTREIKWRA